jgi:arylsulfatase
MGLLMRKNIVFITCDQFRADALGLLKAFPVKTPNLDKLVETGCMFENTYCTGPLCVPSRASIMTGQYCFEHGVYYNDQGWARTAPTMPGLLSAEGYYSIKVGKTHFHPPHRYGGLDKLVGNFDLTHRYDKDAAERDKPGWAGVIQSQYHEKKAPTEYDTFEPVVHTEIAMRELDKIVARRECVGIDATEPFFMWLSHLQPHTPCNPPEPYRSMYPPETLREAIKTAEEVELFAPQLKRGMSYWTDIDDDVRRSFMSRYLGSISLLDKLTGDLIDHLEKLGLLENTLIIFSSDHGDYLGDHHLQQKGFFHDCSSRVPLIFNGPGVAAGRRITENVSLIDLLPTTLDYAGLLQPDRRDDQGNRIYDQQLPTYGESLLPWMKPEEERVPRNEQRVVISETGIYGQGIMLKQGHTKINYYPQSGDWDHFDLLDDPNELTNLGGKQRPPMTPEMEQALSEVLAATEKLAKGHYYFEKLRPMFS